MKGGFNDHHFPCIDVTRPCDRYDLHPPGPRCPHCGGPHNIIEVRSWPGVLEAHCICGWVEYRFRRQKADPRAFRLQGLPGAREKKETYLCPGCGKNPVKQKTHYCKECHQAFREEDRAKAEEKKASQDELVSYAAEMAVLIQECAA